MKARTHHSLRLEASEKKEFYVIALHHCVTQRPSQPWSLYEMHVADL